MSEPSTSTPTLLPDRVAAAADGRPLSIYVHVPYCRTRCGYCDFNTYTASELGPGVGQDSYADLAVQEIGLARSALGTPGLVPTIFFGGGTPTLLPPAALASMLDAIRDHFDLAPDAEITTEANPDSVDPASLRQLREAGFTRVSFGVQSTAPDVLRVLERTHDPDRATAAIGWARAAGFEHISADLIYGTPGESDADLIASVGAVVDAGVDHLSAYALTVEEGTRFAAQVRRGAVAQPSDDVAAERYEILDRILHAAGFTWYEISNWSRLGAQSRHNDVYWTSGNWWGMGPGAHSHVGGVRWWNVRHPRAHRASVVAGALPVAGYEQLSADEMYEEFVLLSSRRRDGLEVSALDRAGRNLIAGLVRDGLVEPPGAQPARLRLTLSGRLMADTVARTLLS